MKNWTVIYDNGWEDVRIKAQPDYALRWAFCDQAGSLEEISWKPDTSVMKLRNWLKDHRVNSDTFKQSNNTSTWENLLEAFSDRATVKMLVVSAKNIELLL